MFTFQSQKPVNLTLNDSSNFTFVIGLEILNCEIALGRSNVSKHGNSYPKEGGRSICIKEEVGCSYKELETEEVYL